MHEIETRIININVDEIRLKLNKLNFPKVKEEEQLNELFDFPDKRLLNSNGYARIRTVNDKLTGKTHYYITVKKMISQEKYKLMEESETEILNYIEGKNILTSLGLIAIQSVGKYRESYKYKNSLVEIDINQKSFCPFPYIEIESSIESEIEEIVNLLGYTMKDTDSRTIYEILQGK